MFLTSFESKLIRKDFKDFLKSAEPCDLEITYKVPVNPVLDPVYGDTKADQWNSVTVTPTPRASQVIIRPTNEEFLRWGLLRTGDALFYLDSAVDLSAADYKSIVLKVKGQTVEWTLIPLDYSKFEEYLGFRLGNTQVAQVLAARQKQP
jgi:hypothetical protein